ncbi:MAG: hypothetical protein ACREJM_09185 [Candidatus Saccharimonadales bacterium]
MCQQVDRATRGLGSLCGLAEAPLGGKVRTVFNVWLNSRDWQTEGDCASLAAGTDCTGRSKIIRASSGDFGLPEGSAAV